MAVLLIFLGGGLGSAARYGVNLWVSKAWGGALPLATLGVNILGSFFMGCIAAYFLTRTSATPGFRLFLMTGVLGGFTTFSAFSLEFWQLGMRGEWSLAVSYAVISLLLSIAAAGLGLWMLR